MQETIYDNVDETIYTEMLDNGLKVCLIPKQGVSDVNGFFTTRYGANDIHFIPRGGSESIEAPLGVAHFLEHKMFDKGSYDAFEKFSALGANANAYTSPTQTAYLFDTTENAIDCVELLLDFVQEPYFTDQTVEKEKGIITQEAQMYADNPDQQLFMTTLEALFAEHPVRHDVLGTIQSIQAITKEDLYTSYHTFYHPSNMTLCITGNIDANDMMNSIRNNQGRKQFTSPEAISHFMPEEKPEAETKEKTLELPVTTPKCMVGIKESNTEIGARELQKRSLLTSMVLDYLFGRSGPFFKELYEAGIIDYTFGHTNTTETTFGYSILTGNTKDPERFQQEMKRLLLSTNTHQFSEVEFERMKKRRIGRILRSMNMQEAIAQNYIWHDHHGLDFFKHIPAIQQLTLDDVNKFLQDWISPEKLAFVKVMPE